VNVFRHHDISDQTNSKFELNASKVIYRNLFDRIVPEESQASATRKRQKMDMTRYTETLQECVRL